jgi:hypothetical protein
MAQILVKSDDNAITIDVIDKAEIGEEPNYVGNCRACGSEITDRGHFEDTMQAAERHADQCKGAGA